MPQVTCPNCGMTINLENRREIDFGLIKNATGKHPRTFTELLHITKLSRASVLMLIAFLLFSSASGYVLAMLLTPPQYIQTYPEPVIIGSFTMALDVNNVTDLYGWQVAIAYNSSQLKVLEITSGGFVGDDFPSFVNSTDSIEDLLLIAGCLHGEVPGKNGSGKLATIVFGYFTENYDDEPKIVPRKVFETLLSDSKLRNIPIGNSTLTLTIIGKP